MTGLTLSDQWATETQGFESASGNVLYINENVCPNCLQPFNQVGRKSFIIGVFTNRGKDLWCAECVDQGVKDNICVQISKLSKKDEKLWKKKLNIN